MDNNLLTSHKNGSCQISIYEDGTKIREWENGIFPQVKCPESIDLKITNFCDAK